MRSVRSVQLTARQRHSFEALQLKHNLAELRTRGSHRRGVRRDGKALDVADTDGDCGCVQQGEIWDVNAARRYDTPSIGMFAPEVLRAWK